MYYLIGDIHGYLDKLLNLINELLKHIKKDDKIIFLGDYIDRGEHSYEVVDFLISLSKKHDCIFLLGNHEDMLLSYIRGEDVHSIYLFNGGATTIRSYRRNCGKMELPGHHWKFYNNLKLYYEGEDFIAVHAGLNPTINNMEDQDPEELTWIREKFFKSNKIWGKTVIFGHTPTTYLPCAGPVFFDSTKNIIGIDSGVIYGGELSCLRWPDKKVFHS